MTTGMVPWRGPSRNRVDYFQCLRVKDRYIYAAQFHVEMAGTPENSRHIMSNFLKLAKEWGGYNPAAKPIVEPTSFEKR